jgi:hypothetical protein
MNDQPAPSEETSQWQSGLAPGGALTAPEPITRRERTERWFQVVTGMLIYGLCHIAVYPIQ